jgi:hypothetical protein
MRVAQIDPQSGFVLLHLATVSTRKSSSRYSTCTAQPSGLTTVAGSKTATYFLVLIILFYCLSTYLCEAKPECGLFE